MTDIILAALFFLLYFFSACLMTFHAVHAFLTTLPQAKERLDSVLNRPYPTTPHDAYLSGFETARALGACVDARFSFHLFSLLSALLIAFYAHVLYNSDLLLELFLALP